MAQTNDTSFGIVVKSRDVGAAYQACLGMMDIVTNAGAEATTRLARDEGARQITIVHAPAAAATELLSVKLPLAAFAMRQVDPALSFEFKGARPRMGFDQELQEFSKR